MRIDIARERQHRNEKYGWKRCPQVVDVPSPRQSRYGCNENKQPYKAGNCLPSSSPPETMSFSSPELRHSSEEDDSESDVNPLLVQPDEGPFWEKRSVMFDDKGMNFRESNDLLCWGRANYSNSDGLDHGYHSMEPLTPSYTSVMNTNSPDNAIYGVSKLRTNANVVVTSLAGDYGRIRNSKTSSKPKTQVLTSLPINNNGSSETLWHSSAWSAPRKSRSYSSCVGPAEKGANKFTRALHRAQSDSCTWNSKLCGESVNHLYINKSADFYSINESSSDLSCSWDDEEWPNRNSTCGDINPPGGRCRQSDVPDPSLPVENNVVEDLFKQMKTSESGEDGSGNLLGTAEADRASKLPASADSEQNQNERREEIVLRENPDVNLASRSFNNFSISSNKRKEILRLLQERRRARDANIFDVHAKKEAKILNTGRGLLRSSCSSSRRNPGRTWTSAYPEIAAGLVLEKVRYDPNWRRQNSSLCSSDDAMKQFCGDVRVSKPLSVPSGTQKSENRHSVSSAVPPVDQSPTENATLGDQVVDRNSNEKATAAEPPKAPSPKPTNENDKEPAKSISKRFTELLGDFDVYDIESTMPTIDWDAMEANLAKAAEEDDWSARRRNDREEIRRRLAFGQEADEPYHLCGSRLTKKPSLTSRLQSGMNLQICFMNETASDSEEADPEGTSTSSLDDSITETKCLLEGPTTPNNNSIGELSDSPPPTSTAAPGSKRQRPSFFFPKQRIWRLRSKHRHEEVANPKETNAAKEVEDFYTRHARLQAEARLALAQAKEMARMQMEIERQKCKKSPIADIVGLSFPNGKHSAFSKQILNSMNIAQLQVIVNDLHSQIETLNEDLVRLLLTRDDLHMEQDSMLVDIEDLTRYLGAKEAGQHPLSTKITSK